MIINTELALSWRIHTFIRIPYPAFCFSDGSLYCTDILIALTTILIILCLFSFVVVVVVNFIMSLFHFTFVFNHYILPDFCL